MQATISAIAVSLKAASETSGPYLLKVALTAICEVGLEFCYDWFGRDLPRIRGNGITRLAGIYIGACCSRHTLFEFIQTYLMQWIGQKMMFDLRRDIFRHMQRMHVGFFDTHAVGRLVTRLTSDVDAVNEMFTDGILAIVDDFFMLTIMAGVMLRMNWWLALLAFCGAAADPDCDAAVPRPRARELPAGARGHCAHQQLYAGTHQRHERGAALQPRGARVPGL